MPYAVRLRSTSPTSADGDPVVLRETSTTRLVCCPTIVDNEQNPAASVKGTLVHQRRANQDQPWEDEATVPLSQLHAGEAVKLTLNTEETERLVEGLTAYRAAHRQHGIELGDHEYEVEIVGSADLVALLAGNEAAAALLAAEGGPATLANLMAIAAELDLAEPLNAALQAMGTEALSHINASLRLAELHEALRLWEENKANADEEFWQQELKKRPWLLSQVFSQPMVIVGDKVYVGGKDITNKGGRIADYLFKNVLSANAAVVEIKTPTAELVSGSEYRQGLFAPGKDLGGGTAQVLDQRDSLLKHYKDLVGEGESHFVAHMPECVLIAGCLEGMSADQRKSFELTRANSRDVEVVTFDELFARVQQLLDLFEGE